MIAENGQLDGTGNPTGLQKVTSSWGATVSRCWIATVGRCDGARARRKVERGKVVAGIPLEAAVIPLAAGGMPNRKLRRKLRVPLALHVRRVPNGLSGLNAPSVLRTLRALNTLRARRAPTGKIRGQTAHRLTGKNCAVNALFMMRNGLILLDRAQITMLGMVHVRAPGTTTRVPARSTVSNCTSHATNSGSLRNRPAWTWADQQRAVLLVPRQNTRRAALQGRTVTAKCRVVPHSNFHSSQGSNLRISNGRHKIMWGNLMPNSPLGSTIHTPVAGMGNRASSTSKPTPIYAIHTPARPLGLVSASSARPVCAQSCADQNSAVLDAWAGH